MTSTKNLHKFQLKLYGLQSIADQCIRDLLSFILLEDPSSCQQKSYDEVDNQSTDDALSTESIRIPGEILSEVTNPFPFL